MWPCPSSHGPTLCPCFFPPYSMIHAVGYHGGRNYIMESCTLNTRARQNRANLYCAASPTVTDELSGSHGPAFLFRSSFIFSFVCLLVCLWHLAFPTLVNWVTDVRYINWMQYWITCFTADLAGWTRSESELSHRAVPQFMIVTVWCFTTLFD